ncbi:MAG TPA: FecR domain-containing protein [Vicinamibacterales bacterium]|nr:FecR domain-containing protein [Vicinamibacterales bacterium]
MSDEYLWNRSGRPDEEVETLERLLGQLRYRHRPWPASQQGVPVSRGASPRRWHRHAVPVALAASVALLVAWTWMARFDRPASPGAAGTTAASWTVTPMSGAPRLAQREIDADVRVPADSWLETDAGSTARLRAGAVGTVEIGPGSRLRVLAAGGGEHRLALVKGTLDAFIWASPGQFFVETPSAVAVDLGCAYRLEVDEQGAGRLRVTAGWVGFKLNGRESLVPSGAVCATRPGHGPGTPHFEDATPAFQKALAAVDEGAGSVDQGALERLLREARRRDALSLWHLLPRLDRASAARVYDRLAALAPPPPEASRELVLAGERGALDAWWDTLGFGPVSRFREWMR